MEGLIDGINGTKESMPRVGKVKVAINRSILFAGGLV